MNNGQQHQREGDQNEADRNAVTGREMQISAGTPFVSGVR
jgi:hypothetical protein